MYPKLEVEMKKASNRIPELEISCLIIKIKRRPEAAIRPVQAVLLVFMKTLPRTFRLFAFPALLLVNISSEYIPLCI